MWFCDFGKKFEYSIRYAHGNMNSTLPILKERGQKYFAVSDYGEISGWISQYFKCKENDIVPILGIQIFLNNYNIENKENELYLRKSSKDEEWVKSFKEVDDDQKDASTIDYNLNLYAKDMEGYYNIIQIHNDAQINGFDKRPRTNDKFLMKHGKGIVCLLNNPYSDVCSLIYNGFEEEALQRYNFYKTIFEDVYMTLPIVQDITYREVNDLMIQFSKEHDIKMIPVINSHYNNIDDEQVFNTFRKISKIRTGISYDVDLCKGMYYKTTEQIEETWKNYLKSEIFDETTYKYIFNVYEELLKKFTLLNLDVSVKLPKIKDGEKVLREKAFEGLKAKGLSDKKEYVNRLEYQLDSIIVAGFADYFLFLEDLYRWYREERNRFPASGRGSAGGSLVLYVLGVQNIDPIKYHLLFERFIDIAMFREKIQKGIPFTGEDMPDVDSDFPGNEKDNVREYFISKYGKNNVCHIGTIGYLKLRGVLKELSRLYDVPLEQVNTLTTQGLKDFDPEDQGLPIEQLKNKYYALKVFLQKYPQFEKVFDKLYGTINCWGIHAGGMIVTDFDLTKQMPVRVTDGKLVSCWSEGIKGRELGQMGFIKMDILAIDALDTIEKTIRLINERHHEKYDLYNIPIDEKESLQQMNNHDNIGIFQFDTNLSNRVVDNMGGITCFEDLAILNTLMRPAALINGFDKKMGELRKSTEQIYIPYELKDSMQETQGMPIFQQAAYFYARDLAGFDNINSRKFMKTLYKGKMKGDAVPYWKQKFLKGCKDKIKRQVIEIQLQDGTIKKYQLDELIECIDGQFRTIQQIIQNSYQIK